MNDHSMIENPGRLLRNILYYQRYIIRLSKSEADEITEGFNPLRELLLHSSLRVIATHGKNQYQNFPECSRRYGKLENKVRRKMRRLLYHWDKKAQKGQITDYIGILELLQFYALIDPHVVIPETLKQKIMIAKISKEY